MKLIPTRRMVSLLGLAVAAGVLAGCAGRVSLMPNSDKSLRKTPAQFASAAAKRTYQSELPDGGEAEARAQVAYDGNYIQILNLSDQDWTNVEVWVNRKYVVEVPRLKADKKRVTTLTFMMLYDDQGNPFPSDNRRQMIDSLEVVREGSRFTVPVALAD